MDITLLGLFSKRAAAEDAIRALEAAGFDERHVGLLLKENRAIQFPAPEKAANAGKGAAAGAVAGGVGGTLVATLGTVIIPGIGPFIAGGILVAALSGAGGGALYGALIGQNVPNFDAQRYQRRIDEGDVLLLVDAGDREDEARQMLQRHGAVDIRGSADLAQELRRISPQSITTVAPNETRASPSQGLADAKTFLAAKKHAAAEQRERREDANVAPTSTPPVTDPDPHGPSAT